MLDHIGLNVSDFEASKAFYLRALEPLGIRTVMEFPEWKSLGLGDGQKPYLWIHERGTPSTSTHVALVVTDVETVDAFHAAAIAAGGTDNGAPGLRPHYHPSYYGAFVLDPDGNNIEAVCHRASGSRRVGSASFSRARRGRAAPLRRHAVHRHGPSASRSPSAPRSPGRRAGSSR